MNMDCNRISAVTHMVTQISWEHRTQEIWRGPNGSGSSSLKKQRKITSKLSSTVRRIVDRSLRFSQLNLSCCTNQLVAIEMGRKNDSDPVPAEKEDADKQSEKPLPLPTVEESDEDDVEAGPMPPKALKRRKVEKFYGYRFRLHQYSRTAVFLDAAGFQSNHVVIPPRMLRAFRIGKSTQ